MIRIPGRNFVNISDDVKLGKNVSIYEFVNLYGCTIGDETQIGAFVEIQRDAMIGRRVRIQSHTFICSGVTIEDDVFVGHNVTFINDRHPTVEKTLNKSWVLEPTVVKKGVSIGSGSTILCGVTIGANAVIGAGSIVTHDVPSDAVVCGNPARPLSRTKK